MVNLCSAKLAMASVAALLLGWAYQATRRSRAAALLGSPRRPTVSSPRVRLKDGRYLAYRELGVDRKTAKYKIIFAHGFASTKESEFPVSQELAEELGICLLYFDRAGYGESDVNPTRGLKSDATDIEELADALQLGDRFYVLGSSLGGYVAWSCLHYIPQRLAGVALVVPAVNYWWPLPADVSRSAYEKLSALDRRTLWIAHHMPSLFYAWFTQKWFELSPIVRGERDAFTDKDWEIISELRRKQLETGQLNSERAIQHGTYYSLCRDVTLVFGNWDFDPTKIKNPFPNGEGVVSLWAGYEDKIVRVEIQRYMAQKLPWIRYHEHREAGHALADMDGAGDDIVRELLLGGEVGRPSSNKMHG